MGTVSRTELEPAGQEAGLEQQKDRRKQRAMDRQLSESEETKSRQERLISRLLDEFDLEETKDKYRTGMKQDVTVAGPGSSGCLRRQLVRLMGSDVIRMTDQKWNDKFLARLEEDYRKQEEQREVDLAELELQRLRRLRLEGILPLNDPESETTPRKGRHSPRRKRKKSPRKSKSCRFDSQSPQREGNRSCYNSSPPPHHAPLSKDIRTQMETLESERGSNSPRRSPSPRHTARHTPGSSPRHSPDSLYKGGNSESDGDSQSVRLRLEAEDGKERSPDDTFSARSTGSWVSRRAPLEVCQLYQQESVDDLYTFAEKLVH